MATWLTELLSSPKFWNVVYIILGFALGQSTSVLTGVLRRRRLRKALFDELDANGHQIKQKLDIVAKMMSALEAGTLLPGGSVDSPRFIFESHFGDIGHRLSPIERDNVTHVYATLRKLDAFLDGFASNFKRDLVEKVVMDPWTAAVAALKDVAGTYETTADLITRLIDGHPIDIYHRGKSSKRRTLPRRQGKLAPGGRKDPG